jgi:hypothetical protein
MSGTVGERVIDFVVEGSNCNVHYNVLLPTSTGKIEKDVNDAELLGSKNETE